MTTAIWLPLVAFGAALLSPLTLSYLNGRQAAGATKAQWKREDELEARRAASSAALQESQAALLEAQKASTRAVEGKLVEIHTLVNSDYTARMTGELGAMRHTLVLMREVIVLNEAAGRSPSPESLAALATLESDIARLAAELEERMRQTALMEQAAGE
jgi:hypothetical protein